MFELIFIDVDIDYIYLYILKYKSYRKIKTSRSDSN